MGGWSVMVALPSPYVFIGRGWPVPRPGEGSFLGLGSRVSGVGCRVKSFLARAVVIAIVLGLSSRTRTRSRNRLTRSPVRLRLRLRVRVREEYRTLTPPSPLRTRERGLFSPK